MAERRFETVPDILAAQVAKRPHAVALIRANGDQLTFKELAQLVHGLAVSMQAALPKFSDRQARIGTAVPNGADFIVLQLAAMSLGTFLPFNSKSTAAEFETVFELSDLDVIVTLAGEASLAADVAQMLDIPALRMTSNYLIAGAGPARKISVRPMPDDIAAVLLTSGSTGTPKRVPLSHRNLCCSASEVVRSIDLSPEDRCLLMWEQFHIGGLVDLLLAPLSAGGSLIAGGSFDTKRFFELFDSHSPTWFQTVPTTLQELVSTNARSAEEKRNSSLRLIRSVASATSDQLVAAASETFGVPVVRTLGMTEAGPLITTTDLQQFSDKPGSVGRSVGTEIAIFSDRFEPLGKNLSGQIAIRGENVFGGYEGDDEANKSSFHNGWFLTGDLGYLDNDGDLFLTGRKKELINRGGEKISPSEIDEALAAHPDIEMAASFAVKHRRLGEDVACAFTSSKELELSDVRAFLAKRLSAFKVPRQIYQLAKLPINPVGKIDRYLLAESLKNQIDHDAAPALPTTAIETLVAQVWATELAVKEIDVNQNFAALDGDSLSALRITVALEHHFGRALPDSIFEKFTTVKELSACLNDLGYVPVEQGSETSKTDAIGEIHSEQIVFGGDFAALEAVISSADTRAKLGIILDHAFVHSTASEVRNLQNRIADLKASKELGILAGLVLQRELNNWKRDLARALESSSADWSRQDVSKFVLHYSASSRPESEKHLIVGFSGDRMRLLMPTFRVLAGLDPARFDLLLLMDPQKKLFLDGIPGIDGGLPGAAKFCHAFASERGYKGIIGLGTSGGSAAALEAGCLEGFNRLLLVAPLTISQHLGLAERLANVRNTTQSSAIPMRIVHGRKGVNRDAALEFQRLFPEMDVVEYRHARKGIFPAAEARQELRQCLQDWMKW